MGFSGWTRQRFSTPLYVYDGEKISQQIRGIETSVRAVKHKIKYAVKALIGDDEPAGVGADVVSIFRAQLALKAGILPLILCSRNGVAFSEIQRRRCTGFVGQCW